MPLWLRSLLVPSLWILLQGLALFLYLRYTPTAHSALSRFGLEVAHQVQRFFAWVRSPWLALKEVQKLHQLNSQLLSALELAPQIRGEASFPVGAWGDFAAAPRYTYLPARLIHRTFHPRKNFALIDKGARAGLYPGLGVIAPEGVVGIIAETTATYSVVYPLFHQGLHVTAELPLHGVYGSTSWKGQVLNQLSLDFIPLYIQVKEGEEVWTGPSTIFPAGLRIGRVARVDPDYAGGFYTITLRTYVDWHRVWSVYVLVPSSP